MGDKRNVKGTRGNRKRHIRPLTEVLGDRFSKNQKVSLFLNGEQYPQHTRPLTRSDCKDVKRPCPYVGCKYHNYLEVKKNGNITFRFPDIGPDEMTTPSCSLDVAEQGGATLESVGEYMNITRERARQLQVAGLHKITKEGVF